MPVKLAAPRYETFPLEKTDKRYANDGEPTTVTIKQALRHEHDARNRLFAKVERRWSDSDEETIRLVQDVAMVDVYAEEAWLTMVECNIQDADGTLMFPSKKGKNGHPELKMSKAEFKNAWGRLFPDINEEIIDKIHEVNLLWAGPVGEVV